MHNLEPPCPPPKPTTSCRAPPLSRPRRRCPPNICHRRIALLASAGATPLAAAGIVLRTRLFSSAAQNSNAPGRCTTTERERVKDRFRLQSVSQYATKPPKNEKAMSRTTLILFIYLLLCSEEGSAHKARTHAVKIYTYVRLHKSMCMGASILRGKERNGTKTTAPRALRALV